MMHKNRLWPLAVLLFGSLWAYGLEAHAESALIVKAGNFKVTHNQQDLDGFTRTINEEAKSPLGIGWEQRDADGVAQGAEFLRFNTDWNGGGQGRIATRSLLYTIKRYQEYGRTNPYLGAGIGVMHANSRGGGIDFEPALGLALQLMGGVEFRWEGVGAYAEIKGLYSEPGSVFGDDINLSGVGVFLGFSILF